MFRAGDEIGPYRLTSKLGRGAFGVVWLAERRSRLVTTQVALKMPLDDDVDLESIREEARLWVQASGHPNVLPIIEANIYDEQIVVVSEYAPDGSLKTWLERHGGRCPTAASAIEMAHGILAGMGHLHARQIIHRDLKPANLLLQGQTPRLADFGISRVLKTTSVSNLVAGTPAYMAPEAFEGKRNEQTDLWSAGVILYQMLTGQLPFPQADVTSLMRAILVDAPVEIPPTVPGPLQQVLAQALSKDTGRRFQSAAAMREALQWASREPAGRPFHVADQGRSPGGPGRQEPIPIPEANRHRQEGGLPLQQQGANRRQQEAAWRWQQEEEFRRRQQADAFRHQQEAALRQPPAPSLIGETIRALILVFFICCAFIAGAGCLNFARLLAFSSQRDLQGLQWEMFQQVVIYAAINDGFFYGALVAILVVSRRRAPVALVSGAFAGLIFAANLTLLGMPRFDILSRIFGSVAPAWMIFWAVVGACVATGISLARKLMKKKLP